METWLLLHLQCFLIGGLVDSSPLTSASRPGSVSTQVGLQVVLPCSWKSHVVGVDGSTCHIQWTNPEDTVFEQQGVRTWQADNFEGRLAVPQDQLGSGNCSLIISDTQIGDAGSYDSFVVVDGVRAKTRVFIQTVTLLVFDHKALQSRGSGEDWVLELHTRHSVRVIFQGRNSSEWTDLWMRGDTNSERVEKHPHKEQLTIKNLQSLDEGLYKVLDKRGLAISTVQLTVAGKPLISGLIQLSYVGSMWLLFVSTLKTFVFPQEVPNPVKSSRSYKVEWQQVMLLRAAVQLCSSRLFLSQASKFLMSDTLQTLVELKRSLWA